MGSNRPPQDIALTPGKRVLFLTKDLDLIKQQLYDGLDLRMEDLTVDDLLDDLAGRDEIDLISDYAFVIPFAVIHAMLGLPEADVERVRAWSHAMTQTLEPYLTPEQVDAAIFISI